MRLPIGIPLTAALLAWLAAPTISSSQGTRASADRYAARRERAYSRLGNDLLVIRSRWAPGLFTQPAFDQDPTF